MFMLDGPGHNHKLNQFEVVDSPLLPPMQILSDGEKVPHSALSSNAITTTPVRQKLALVVDDRESHLASATAVIKRKGYDVRTAMSLKEAKSAVEQERLNGGFDLIVSDYDYGRKVYQKHRMFDGFRFLKWCVQQGESSEMILHSTVFEPSNVMGKFVHHHIFRVIPHAEKMGISVQPKSSLIGDAWKLS